MQLKTLVHNNDVTSVLIKKYGSTAIIKREKIYGSLINTTSIGIENNQKDYSLSFPEETITPASVIFEVVATPINTPLVQEAKRLHHTIITGKEVMVLQAVEQFILYTGKQPSQEQMIKAIEIASHFQS